MLRKFTVKDTSKLFVSTLNITGKCADGCCTDLEWQFKNILKNGDEFLWDDENITHEIIFNPNDENILRVHISNLTNIVKSGDEILEEDYLYGF